MVRQSAPLASGGGAVRKTSPFAEMFRDFNWGKMLSSVAVGAATGGAYSVFDQTILHRNASKHELPYVTDYLKRAAPDIVRKMEHFYKYRNVVASQRHKDAFREFAVEVMRQSEFVASIYNQVASQGDHVEPSMQVMSLFYQLKDHVTIVIRYLRSMLALIERDDDVDVEHAFNALYECYNNRLFNVQSRFR